MFTPASQPKGVFWLKKETVQPLPQPAGQGGTAQAPFPLTVLKKLRRSRMQRSGSDAGRYLQHLRVYESLRWTGLSSETQNQCKST